MNKRTNLFQFALICGIILVCTAAQLSADQKAPPHAHNSGGLLLRAPKEGERYAAGSGAASVNTRPTSAPAAVPQPPREEGVIREETEDLKEVNGELVRTVQGSLSYDSPEGLAVFVKYTADENGNRASFKIGAGGGGGSGTGGGSPGRVGGGSTSGHGTGGGGGGGGSGGSKSAKGPEGAGQGSSGGGGDRMYLPPQ